MIKDFLKKSIPTPTSLEVPKTPCLLDFSNVILPAIKISGVGFFFGAAAG